ncbi:MAG TPA: PQQ-binding-like beta-propeller repeat protein [Pirellulales bacterium]|jgi:outer membrane protein assembly factor BamB|nr:PQQ-binding-like beta-propeller repeat protein [Pirellulales bacterium]
MRSRPTSTFVFARTPITDLFARAAFASVVAGAVLAQGILSAAETDVKNWPQFLGPTRNGQSTDKNLVDSFPKAGPKIVWRVPGGEGMSGIALEGGIAITLVQRDGKQTALALDAATGKERWSQPITAGYDNSMGTGPRGTPTIAAGSVYAFSGEGVLAALEQSTGKIRWQHDVVRELHGEVADYGMACSPLVVDGIVMVTAGAPGGTVVAYQADSGKLAWKLGNDTAGYSSPALLHVGGQTQIVVFTGNAAIGLEPSEGKQLWRYPYKTNFDCNIATPIAVGDDVFISAGENHGSALLKLNKAGSTFDVQEVWTSFGPKSVLRNEWQTSLLHNGYLYGFDNIGGAGPITNLTCVNAKTGERVWQQAKFGKGNAILADGKLYIITIKGELVIVRAIPEKFDELARAKVLDTTRQAPALVDGHLYLRDSDDIVCVDIRAAK